MILLLAAALVAPARATVVARSAKVVVIRQVHRLADGVTDTTWWGRLRGHRRLRRLQRLRSSVFQTRYLDQELAAGTFVAAERVSIDHYGEGAAQVLTWDVSSGRRREAPAAFIDASEGGVDAMALGPQGTLLWLAHDGPSTTAALTLKTFNGSARRLASGPIGSISGLQVTRDAAIWIQDGATHRLSLSG